MRITTENEQLNKNNNVALKIIAMTLLFITILVGVFLSGVFLQRGHHLTDLANYLRSSPSDFKNSFMANTNLIPITDLPSVTIDIKSTNKSKMKEHINNALSIGRITNKQKKFYNAKLQYNGEIFDIKLRLKGDNTDHLNTQKVSFRIKIKNGKKLFGMSEFSISHPKTRQYANEWLYTEAIRSEGILTPRNGFLNVSVNGKDHGIYIFEEHYTKEMIESQGYKESVVFYMSSIFRDWQRTEFKGDDVDLALYGGGGWNFDNVPDSAETRDVDVFKRGKVVKVPYLNSLREFGISRLISFYGGKIPAHQVFDAEKMGKALAIIELFAAHNTAHPDNFRFYLNPYTMLLEPVIREGNVMSPIGLSLSSTDLDIMPTMLADEKISSAFISNLERYTGSDFLKKLKSNIGSDYSNIVNTLRTEFPFVNEIWGDLEFRASFLKRVLSPPKLIQAVARYVGKEKKILSMDVSNVNTYPVQLVGIALSTDTKNIIYPDGKNSAVLSPYQPYWANSGRNYRPILLKNFLFNLSDKQKKLIQHGAKVLVVSRLSGASNRLYNPLTTLLNDEKFGSPKSPSMHEFLSKIKFFYLSDDGRTLKSIPGSYTLDDNLVFPKGINVELVAGTHISFPENGVMLLSGALKIYGSDENPVTLSPALKHWGGIAVINAKETSLLNNARIIDTSGVSVDGWSLSGGVTFYKSDIEIIDTLISGSTAEDALNIVSAKFKIIDSKVGVAVSDGFDGDFVSGIIENSMFYDIAGDGVDFSGSTINIKNVNIRNIEDKAVSAGESSLVTIDASKITDVGIAVASKDGSKVDIHNIEITGAHKIGFAAYRKKEEYPYAEIFAINANISNTKTPVLVQKGSHAVINDESYSGEIIDVKKLYGSKILGN